MPETPLERVSRSPIESLLERADRGVEALERAVLVAAILLMAAMGAANVVSRNVLGRSLASADELAQMLMIVVTFLGIGYGARYARHIRMSAVHEQLPPRARKVLWVVCSAGTALLLGVLAYHAVRYTLSVRATGRVSPVLQAPLWVVYACAPLGLALGAWQYVLAIVRNLISAGPHLSFRMKEEPPDAAHAATAATVDSPSGAVNGS
jgi:TRAP-type C4-dicarboxylate transport system permease small subunit